MVINLTITATMKSIFKSASLLIPFLGLFLLTGCFSSGDNLFEVFQHARTNLVAAIHFIISAIFIYEIVKSNRSSSDKVIWIAIIFFLPVVGFLAYYFFGRK